MPHAVTVALLIGIAIGFVTCRFCLWLGIKDRERNALRLREFEEREQPSAGQVNDIRYTDERLISPRERMANERDIKR